jgi:hypothetical protein
MQKQRRTKKGTPIKEAKKGTPIKEEDTHDQDFIRQLDMAISFLFFASLAQGFLQQQYARLRALTSLPLGQPPLNAPFMGVRKFPFMGVLDFLPAIDQSQC